MGAGILPISFKDGKIYFLFSREAGDKKFRDTGKWSDFGGSKEKNETYEQTAIREGWEESNGILGNKKAISNLLHNNLLDTITDRGYKVHIVYINYNDVSPRQFRRDFLKMYNEHPEKIRKKGLYEKDMIKWFSYDELKKKIQDFRPWYRKFIYKIIDSY